MPSLSFARGSKAWGDCMRCGLRFLLRDLRHDGQYRNVLVCGECWDAKHPQERLISVGDPVALHHPSPDQRPNPSAVTIAGGAAGSDVNLTWGSSSAPASLLLGYHVLRSTDNLTFTQIADVPIEYDDLRTVIDAALSYTDESLASGTYYYRVRAYDARGSESDSSNTLTVTI